MRVCGQVGDDLIAGDAAGDGGLDAGFGDFGRHEVGVAGVELGEEGEDGDEEGAVGVGVEAVIGFDYDVAFFVLGRGGGVVGVRAAGCCGGGGEAGVGKGGGVRS